MALPHKILILTLIFTHLFYAGCATEIGGNSYEDATVGEVSQSYKATILNIRSVKVSPDKLESSHIGTVAGGAAGAIVGSQFGSGVGSTLMSIGGGIAGAVGGAAAEKSLKTQNAFEITVELKNGELRTLVQGNDVTFVKGESVMLVLYNHGRSKVVKLQ